MAHRTLLPGGRLGAPKGRVWVRTSYLKIVKGKLGPTPDWNPPLSQLDGREEAGVPPGSLPASHLSVP